jgi:hypothetical protein
MNTPNFNEINDILLYPTSYMDDTSSLTDEQLSVLVIALSSDNTPRSMFTKVAIQLCRRFTDVAIPNSEYASTNLSAGIARSRNTRMIKAVKESHGR